MTTIAAQDGTKLHIQDTGASGDAAEPVLFLHEFAGTSRSWEPQLRAFGSMRRCIAYNARGYPPSDIPEDPAAYSQDIAVADAIAVLDALKIDSAHIVGHSMGAYTTLHIGLRHPDRVKSLTVAGVGWGSDPATLAESKDLAQGIADMFRDEPIETSAAAYADYPMRQSFKRRDPRGWAEFAAMLADHSPLGSALTMENVQKNRPTLPDMEADLADLTVPLLVVVGDEDEACIEGSFLLKRTVPGVHLLMLPKVGHTTPSEVPDQFNAALARFWADLAAG